MGGKVGEVNPVNWLVVWLFTIPNIGLWIALAICAWCIGLIVSYRQRRYVPLVELLQRRVEALGRVAEAQTDDEAHKILADNFDSIDTAMTGSQSNRHSEHVRHAWTQFKETIIDESAEILEATARPESYFLHLGDESRSLAWWANIFVAVGLTFTFLGIVAALLQAVVSMNSQVSPENMQASLISLLNITAAKFWTSIAGVGSSIALRIYDRRYTSTIATKLQLICDRLEYGTLFSPPQRLAALQLRETKQQTAALTTFSTEVALSISNAFEQIGTGVGDVISEHAGREIRGLAESLVGLNDDISSLREELAAMSGAFQDSNESFSEHADALSSAAIRAGVISEVLNQAADDLAKAAVPLSEVQTVAERVTDKLEEVVASMNTATSSAAQEIKTIADGIEQSNDAAKAAWEEYRARFVEIDDALVTAVERIANTTSDHADNLNSFVGKVDEGMAGAVQNLRAALDRIGDLADSLEEVIQRQGAGRNVDA